MEHCVTAHAGRSAVGPWECVDGAKNQLWEFTRKTNARGHFNGYELKNVASKLCLDVREGRFQRYTYIITYKCNDRDNQRWSWTIQPDGKSGQLKPIAANYLCAFAEQFHADTLNDVENIVMLENCNSDWLGQIMTQWWYE